MSTDIRKYGKYLRMNSNARYEYLIYLDREIGSLKDVKKKKRPVLIDLLGKVAKNEKDGGARELALKLLKKYDLKLPELS